MSRTITKDQTVMMEEIRSLISNGTCVTLTAKGNSMNPFIVHLRDQITLCPFNEEDIREGSVALVKDNRGKYLIHRIVGCDNRTVTLMGDGNVGLTETADYDNIIGIMKSVTRKGRTHTTGSFIWKSYSWIWRLLRPVRRYPLGIWRRLNKKKVFDFSKAPQS